MKGTLFAIAGGFFLTLQSVANARISSVIGTWQAATITQMTGFLVALLVAVMLRDKTFRQMKHVKPIYLSGGALAAIVLFSNITAVHRMGVTLTISIFLIAQLLLALLIDRNGWFGMVKRRLRTPQVVGIALMIIGVVILKL